jgi:hypothetical protein
MSLNFKLALLYLINFFNQKICCTFVRFFGKKIRLKVLQ